MTMIDVEEINQVLAPVLAARDTWRESADQVSAHRDNKAPGLAALLVECQALHRDYQDSALYAIHSIESLIICANAKAQADQLFANARQPPPPEE